MIKSMFKKTYIKVDPRKHVQQTTEKGNTQSARAGSAAADLWRKCNHCGKPVFVEDVHANYNICPKCGGYFRISAYRRISHLADEGTFHEWDREMDSSNPLEFPGYEKKLMMVREKTRLNEAVVTGTMEIDGHPAAVGVCDSRFFMSSMGRNMGEKITRAIERATDAKLPVILFACSGGARMQEGIISLMQMAKTSAALKRHHDAGQLFISVLTDPTTGGVTASFAMLGDIILAEPGALIGFAGPRVIEQTIGQKLPEGFQRAEFLLEHGFIDRIVKREELKQTLAQILKLHDKNPLSESSDSRSGNLEEESKDREQQDAQEEARSMMDVVRDKMTSAWETVCLSRKTDRPVASDYIHALFEDFIELHGDRYYGDDGAVTAGIASFHGIPVTVIGQEKGRTTKENMKRNFGMPSPEGYRKALRLMKQAETFGRPVICFVDTPGAFCGMEAEERGQGEAIARNLYEMSALSVPVLSIVIGEGGSGGALALAVANEVWMLENSVYSILSPEGFASILWKDSKRAGEAAGVMKMTAGELKRLGIIEHVIPETQPASAETMPELQKVLDASIRRFLREWTACSEEEIINRRYRRFRAY